MIKFMLLLICSSDGNFSPDKRGSDSATLEENISSDGDSGTDAKRPLATDREEEPSSGGSKEGSSS